MSRDMELWGNKRAQEGAAENKKETAERMIRAGKLSDAEIADYSGLTLKQVQEIKSEMTVMA